MIRKTVLCRSYEGASPRLVIGARISQNDATAQSLDWKPGARIFLELFKAFRRCALNDTRRPVDHKDVCDNFVVLKMMYRLSLWTSNLVLIFFWNYFRSSDDVHSMTRELPVDHKGVCDDFVNLKMMYQLSL